MSGEITVGTKVLIPAVLDWDRNTAGDRVVSHAAADYRSMTSRWPTRSLVSLEALRDVLRRLRSEATPDHPGDYGEAS